jgi:hypothetical protein
MIEEARLERVESGLTPVTAGWFVVNARDAAWLNNDLTQSCCIFESDDFVLRGRPDLTEYVKPGAGFALRVLRPGRPADPGTAERSRGRGALRPTSRSDSGQARAPTWCAAS